jgi:hypothetical protein
VEEHSFSGIAQWKSKQKNMFFFYSGNQHHNGDAFGRLWSVGDWSYGSPRVDRDEVEVGHTGEKTARRRAQGSET